MSPRINSNMELIPHKEMIIWNRRLMSLKVKNSGSEQDEGRRTGPHLTDSRCCWRLALFCRCWTVSTSSLPEGMPQLWAVVTSAADPDPHWPGSTCSGSKFRSHEIGKNRPYFTGHWFWGLTFQQCLCTEPNMFKNLKLRFTFIFLRQRRFGR